MKVAFCIGDVMLDRRIEGRMTRISPEAPAPVVELDRITEHPGGAANVAVNLAAMGVPVLLLGAVGDDSAGISLGLSIMGDLKTRLVRLPAVKTIVKTRITCSGQQILRVDEGGQVPASDELLAAVSSGQQVIREAYPDGLGAVVLVDYAKGTLSDAVIAAADKMARDNGVPLFVSARPQRLPHYAGRAGVAVLNAVEAMAAVNECGSFVHPALALADSDASKMEVAAKSLVEHYGFGCVVVTRGPYGASVFDGRAYSIATVPQQVFDVTGAGDTFFAALCQGFVFGLSLEESVRRANVAGGLAVRQHHTAVISRAEIDEEVRARMGPAGKVMSLEQLVEYLEFRRSHGLSLVGLANGCFDGVHAGHAHLIRYAKTRCDLLIVAYNDDASVTALKGADRPLMPGEARAYAIAQLPDADRVLEFDGNVEALVRKLHPDVLFKGIEYRDDAVPGSDYVASRGGQVVFVPMMNRVSTTRLATG